MRDKLLYFDYVMLLYHNLLEHKRTKKKSSVINNLFTIRLNAFIL